MWRCERRWGLAGKKEVAVLGCGALGLTAALTAQRFGLKVTIYAKERPPYVRSARATGSWTPDSRVALKDVAPPEFAERVGAHGEDLVRDVPELFGAAGDPIEWTDRYLSLR